MKGVIFKICVRQNFKKGKAIINCEKGPFPFIHEHTILEMDNTDYR